MYFIDSVSRPDDVVQKRCSSVINVIQLFEQAKKKKKIIHSLLAFFLFLSLLLKFWIGSAASICVLRECWKKKKKLSFHKSFLCLRPFIFLN